MKTTKSMLLAFLLNLGFSLFECIGGLLTGSVAILSDAIHDMGDAASIGIACFLEHKSKKQPDEHYTYGYARFSVLGSLITTAILLVGSAAMIVHAISRIFNPAPIHYDGMILFALIGVFVNFCAAFFTRKGDSLNQKAVNLHMLEDVLGWAVVLVGAIVMRFSDFALLDPILSMGVSVFILFHALSHLREVLALFLEKAPVDVGEIRAHICEIPGILDVHHLHLWSMDGSNHYATMHIVTDHDHPKIKAAIRKELQQFGIGHITLELEAPGEHCCQSQCHVAVETGHHHHHHGHHHH